MGEMDARMSFYKSRPRSVRTLKAVTPGTSNNRVQGYSVTLPLIKADEYGDRASSLFWQEQPSSEATPSPSACSGYDGWFGDSYSPSDVNSNERVENSWSPQPSHDGSDDHLFALDT